MKKIISIAVIFFFIFSSIAPAFAADAVWNGSSSAVWADNANWSAAYPVSGNTATFNAVGSGQPIIDVSGDVAALSVVFGTGAVAYTIGDTAGVDTLTLDANGGIQMTDLVDTNQTFNCNIILNGTNTFRNDSVNNTLTFNGAINSASGTTQDLRLAAGSSDMVFNVAMGTTDSLGDLTILTGRNITTSTITAETISQLTGTGTTTFNGAVQTSAAGGVSIINNAIAANSSITTTGTGIVTLDATGGALTIAAAGDIVSTGAVNLTGATGIITGGDVTTTNDNITYHSAVTLTGVVTLNSGTGIITFDSTLDNGGFLLTIDNDTGASDSTITGVMSGSGGLTKEGTGVLALNGVNTYTGVTTIDGGIVKISADSGLGAAPSTATPGQLVFNGGTLQTTADTTLNSNRGIALTGDGTFSTDASTTLTSGGIIAGAGGLIKIGTGTLALSGENTYSGGTTITTGTLQASHVSALGTGFVTNNATLDVGTTDVAGIGVYTQNANSKFKVTVDSATTSGSISSSVAADVDTNSSIDVTVASNLYVPTGATFMIIDTGAKGIGDVPDTINTLVNRHVLFSGSGTTGNLILTADRSANGFASDATDSNGRNVGQVLDNVTNPTSDMTTVLNTLEGLDKAQTAAALDTMVPEIDSGILDNGRASLSNFVGVSLERAQDVLTNAAAGNSAGTGISSGDDNKLNGIWAKGYGSYLDQGTRNGIKGYNAWNAGTAIGVDRLLSDTFTLGVSGGYAYGKVNSDANNAQTDITSGQGTVYAGYQDANYPYFIDAAGSFAWNWYQGKRDVSVGSINRTVNADYDGQQYGLYLGGGYKFNLGNNIELTPLASIQWNHLRLAGYTETNAGSMNLSVGGQDYDLLESGLGARISSLLKYKWGNFTPEVHVKWLYDFINDAMAVTSTFTGGGGSFSSNGTKSAKNGVNLGGKLSFDFKNDVSIIGGCDAEVRDQFVGVYGSATLRYKF